MGKQLPLFAEPKPPRGPIGRFVVCACGACGHGVYALPEQAAEDVRCPKCVSKKRRGKK